MAVLPPKVTGDGTTDSWSFEATNNINLNEERIEALLDAMQNLADGSSVDQLRDAIIAALS